MLTWQRAAGGFDDVAAAWMPRGAWDSHTVAPTLGPAAACSLTARGRLSLQGFPRRPENGLPYSARRSANFGSGRFVL